MLVRDALDRIRDFGLPERWNPLISLLELSFSRFKLADRISKTGATRGESIERPMNTILYLFLAIWTTCITKSSKGYWLKCLLN
jgi:hypothetical protein